MVCPSCAVVECRSITYEVIYSALWSSDHVDLVSTDVVETYNELFQTTLRGIVFTIFRNIMNFVEVSTSFQTFD